PMISTAITALQSNLRTFQQINDLSSTRLQFPYCGNKLSASSANPVTLEMNPAPVLLSPNLVLDIDMAMQLVHCPPNPRQILSKPNLGTQCLSRTWICPHSVQRRGGDGG